jgi:hypothetical protein
MNKQTWQSPELTNYGSAATLTKQFGVNKSAGSSDVVNFAVPGIGVIGTVTVPGTLQGITVDGNLVS